MSAPMPVETVPPTEAPSEIACYDITVWCSGTIANLTREQINRITNKACREFAAGFDFVYRL